MKLLFENWRKYLEEELYHGTSDVHKEAILQSGVQSPSHWGTYQVAEYYADVATDIDGGNKMIIHKKLSDFDQSLLKPDQNSIEEPLTYTLRKTEDEVWEEWEESDGTWQASLSIVESVVYQGEMSINSEEIE